MEPWYVSLFRSLPNNREAVTALLPMVRRYGTKGAVVLARGYLGPVAREVECRALTPTDPCGQPVPKEPIPKTGEHPEPASAAPAGAAPAPDQPAKEAGLDRGEMAILGMALTKLVYEIGELALHNPTVSASGKQPEFKLDEYGQPPAVSLSHVIAATRLWRSQAADSAALQAAERARAQAPAVTSPRARLQAARGERYALSTRYSYLPAGTSRVSR